MSDFGNRLFLNAENDQNFRGLYVFEILKKAFRQTQLKTMNQPFQPFQPFQPLQPFQPIQPIQPLCCMRYIILYKVQFIYQIWVPMKADDPSESRRS